MLATRPNLFFFSFAVNEFVLSHFFLWFLLASILAYLHWNIHSINTVFSEILWFSPGGQVCRFSSLGHSLLTSDEIPFGYQERRCAAVIWIHQGKPEISHESSWRWIKFTEFNFQDQLRRNSMPVTIAMKRRRNLICVPHMSSTWCRLEENMKHELVPIFLELPTRYNSLISWIIQDTFLHQKLCHQILVVELSFPLHRLEAQGVHPSQHFETND
jgi:hypothetical protein